MDLFNSIVEGDNPLADMIGGGSVAGLDPTGGWLTIAGQLFGGKSEISQAASGSDSLLNTSGFVIGKGNASGGTASNTKAANWPWYAWAAGALVAIAIIKKAV